MGSQGPKSSKSTKPTTTTPAQSTVPPSSASLSSHLAMVELKQRILNSISKLSDRDTHQIAIEELETLIQTLQNDAVPMLLNCLFDSSSSDQSKPSVKKESIRLLAAVCGSHPDSTGTHLVKIIAHIAKRLRDPDSGVREACKDAIGNLSGIYIKGENSENGVVSLFVRPLFEAMGENNKGVQVGAAMCLGRVVDCAVNPQLSSFQKLCPRVCKYLNSPNFFAKSALLPVVSSLSQVGAITPANLDPLLKSIHDCLASTDWATRKAAAEALIALALHSTDLVKNGASSTLTALEACRFDKIKPVRESMTEALQHWKKLSGKAVDVASDDRKVAGNDLPDNDKQKHMKSDQRNEESSPRDLSNNATSSDSVGKTKNGNYSDKAVGILKKKLPAFSDKILNPEFFQKLEKGGSDDLPVEVVVPRKCLNPSNANGGEVEINSGENKDSTDKMPANIPSRQRENDGYMRVKCVDDVVSGNDLRPGTSGLEDRGLSFSKADGQTDGSLMNGKGNWLAIQRQLLQLERQQAHVMNMLQEFMGGSHDSMVTLENRVRGLERVVEDMAHDLSISSSRRVGNFRSGYDGSSNRPGRYNGYLDYGGRLPFGDRFTASEGVSPSMRVRAGPWRSEHQEPWDFHSYGASKNGQPGNRRDAGSNSVDGRSPRSEHENEQFSARRAWDKGTGNVRLGEGPSARSVWQASKDEATLAAIRGAGEDSTTVRPTRVAVRELEAMGCDNNEPERDPVWTSWSNAMDAVQVGDMDTAYAEVVSTGDDSLLVKLMDKSGPVFDQLSNEVAVEVMNAIMPFVVEQNLYDLSLSWVQQLLDLVVENGPDIFNIPIEVKRDLLFSLHDASSSIELPEEWEGATPDQLMLQLASAWDIDLQQPGS
ncbi:microtubule-associated protein TORTIFOLIA1-like [Chenopodium quinoa]|uniref:microtubule-associated protein TORTIFOLIA1-like n=1 Tax=Chenopodium quinoa TaxID=63459 RepID=UPI000B78FB6E|nr:microtubule-associated protein TORTIFOLIA1-like [Chenopodium quinoa]